MNTYKKYAIFSVLALVFGLSVNISGNVAFAQVAPSISPATSTVANNTPVVVSFTNSTSTLSDWIGVYSSLGAADTAFVDWQYASNCTKKVGAYYLNSGTCSFSIVTPGNYQFRFFSNNGYTKLATSSLVTVTIAPAPSAPATVSISASPSSSAVNTPISVSFLNSTSTKSDWIGLYNSSGAADNAYLQWQYANSCSNVVGASPAPSGTCTFTIPNTGNYEFRLFSTSGYIRLATSSTIAVTSAPATPATQPSISATPNNVAAKAVISVSIVSPTPTPADWIGVYSSSGAADNAYLAWKYTSSCSTVINNSALSTSTCSFALPNGGNYEFRLFSNIGYTKLATSNTIAVTSAPPYSVIASPVSVQANAPVSISFTNPASNKIDWIGVYSSSGAADNAYVSWQYTNSCSTVMGALASSTGTCTFQIPNTGNYEFRYFSNSLYNKVATSNTIAVTSANKSSISAKPATGATTKTFVAVPFTNTTPTQYDWIGVYSSSGATDKAYVGWQYTSSCSTVVGSVASTTGTCSFKMANAGTYEFRLFSTSGYTKLGVSNSVVVGN